MLLPWIRRFARRRSPPRSKNRERKAQLRLEPLEQRVTPVVASITGVAPDVSVAEDVGSVVVTVGLDVAAGNFGLRVFYKFQNGGGPSGATGGTDPGILDGTVDFIRPLVDDSVFFAPGQQSKDITIPIVDDNASELDETFKVILKNDAGYTLGAAKEAEITIEASDGQAVTLDAIADVAEGNSRTITARVAENADEDIFVHIALSGSAKLTGTFADYTLNPVPADPNDIVITIAQGTKTGTLTVNTVDDARDEFTEDVVVDIVSVEGPGSEGGGFQQRTFDITDNDAAPTVRFKAPNTSSDLESVLNPQGVIVQLSAQSGKTIVVTLLDRTAVAGSAEATDYTLGSTTITFNEGETEKVVPLTVNEDDEIEINETIALRIDSATNDGGIPLLTRDHVHTITDNDPTVSFKLASSSSTEGDLDPNADRVEVILNAAAGALIEVNFTVSPAPGDPGQPTNGAPPNNDFDLPTPGFVSFAAGVTSAFIDVGVIDDSVLNELPENVVITLTSIKTGTAFLHGDPTKLTHTHTINDNDGRKVSFVAAATPVTEQDPPAADIVLNVALNLSIVDNVQATTVDFVVLTTPGPGEVFATGGGVDFTLASGQVSIPAGATSADIQVTIHHDNLSEYPELIKIELTGTSANAFVDQTKKLHTITITDDDPNTVPKLSRNPTLDLPILDQSEDEGTQLTVDLFGIDPDIVAGAQSLSFTIENALPASVTGSIVPDLGDPKHAQLVLTGGNGDLTFLVTIRVTDNFDAGSFDEQTFSVTIDNVLPTEVSAGPDQTVGEGSLVNLTGTFVDPANPLFETRTFLWTVLASNGQVITPGTTQNFSFRPNDNGTYTVTFTVADDVGAGTPGSPPDADNVVVITVNNVLPVVGAMPDVTTLAGVAFSNSGFFVDPGSVDNWTVTADFGDGTSATIPFTPDPVIPNRFNFTVSHAYALSQTSPVAVNIHVADKEQQQEQPPTSSSTRFDVIIAPVTPDDCLTNASFEDVVLSLADPIPEWDIAAGGHGVQTQLFGIPPTHGAQYAVIDTVDFVSGTSTAGFVGPNGQVGTDGTVLTKRFEINDQQTLTFFYDFLTNEGTPSFFNDFARGDLFRLNPDGSVAETFFLFAEDTQSVFQAQPVFGSGFAFHTGFKSASFDPNPILNPGTAGTNTYLLQLVVSDVIDTVVSSGLALDEFRLTNLKPVIDPLPAAPVVVNEGAPFSQVVTFTDEPGCDTWSALIDFGDGTVTTVGVGQAFTLNHTYADDGTYTIRVTVQDTTITYLEHLTSDTVQMTVSVQNVAPTLNVAPVLPAEVLEGQPLNIVNIGTILDPGFDNPLNPNQQPGGSKETFTFTINWGDNQPNSIDTGSATIDQVGSPGILTQASFDGTHTYLNDSFFQPPGPPDGVYTVQVTVTDDDRGVSAVKTFTVKVTNVDIFVTATDAGTPGKIKVFDANTKLQKFLITPFGSFTGGIRVATGDVNGDGRPDIIAGQGPGGGARVRVFDGKTGAAFPLPFGGTIGFKPFPATFTGGVFVAAGDINGDGKAEVIVGTNAGIVARVKIFSGDTTGLPLNATLPAQLGADIVPFGSFTGGVRVAVGDLDGDKDLDVITARGPGTTSEVQTRLNTGGSINSAAALSFLAYDQGTTVLRSGVFVAAGDVNGDGKDEIITGPGNASSTVKVFSGNAPGGLIASFQAYEPTYLGGVRVAATDLNGDGRADIVTSPASFGAKTAVRAFDGSTIDAINDTTVTKLTDFFSFFPSFSGGVFAAGNVRRRVF